MDVNHRRFSCGYAVQLHACTDRGDNQTSSGVFHFAATSSGLESKRTHAEQVKSLA